MCERIPVKAPCPGTALIRAGFLGYRCITHRRRHYHHDKIDAFIFVYGKDGHNVRVSVMESF